MINNDSSNRRLQYDEAVILMVSGVFACILIIIFCQQVTPIVPDEIGYLSISKYIVSGEAINVAIIPIYRFGQSILLLPAFVFGSTPEEIYRIGGVLGCIQTAFIPIVLLRIGKSIGVENNSISITAAFLVAIFPAYFYQIAMVWPEASFRLFFLVSLYLILLSWASGKSWLWILALISVVWLYALHQRALGVLPIAGLLVLCAWIRGRISLSMAGVSLLILGGGAYLVNYIQQYFVSLLWPGKGSDASTIGMLVGMIASGQSIFRLLTAVSGQAWMIVASSFGLYIFGFVYALKLVRAQPLAGPAIIFAFWASVAIFAASVLQMAAHLVRIDHVIYGRYNNGASTLFVWLGLTYMLNKSPMRKGAIWIAGLAVGLGGLTVLFSSEFAVSTIIDPNISSLLWVGQLIPLSEITLDEVIAVGTISTVLVALAWLAPIPLRFVIIISAVLASNYFAFYAKKGWNLGRHSMFVNNSDSYAPYQGRLYWDKSAEKNDNIVFDQFMVIDGALPWSDLSTSDIPEGAAAISDSKIRKPGYTCASKLSYGLVLLVRGPTSTHCGGMDTPPVVLVPRIPRVFSDPGIVRGIGWSHVEPWGRWTEGRRATLNFVLPEVAVNYVLEFVVHSYLEGQPDQQRVTVRVNSQAQPDWMFTRDAPTQIVRIPIPDAAKDLEIELEFPDARSPQQARVSSDTRLLGIGVGAVCLSHADEACLSL